MKKVEITELSKFLLTGFFFQRNCTNRICFRVTRCSISCFATRWSRWRNKRQCI